MIITVLGSQHVKSELISMSFSLLLAKDF